MHPIERLRYVARSSGTPAGVVVRETASALAGLGLDHAGLVTACRRVLDRHPVSGPLWWLCSRILTAEDPRREAWRAADEVEEDGTAGVLAYALPDDATVCVLGWPDTAAEAVARRGDAEVLVVDVLGEGGGLVRALERADVDAIDIPVSGLGAAVAAADLLLLEASAVGPDGFVGVAGSLAAASVARHAGTPVWLTAGIGRTVPARVWEALVRRLGERGDPWDREDEVVTLDLVDQVATPAGVVDVPTALHRVDCPIAPELFKFPPRL